MKNILVSGLLNVETSVKIDKFPMDYCPINFNFFGVNSVVSGVGVNVAKAFKTLGDNTDIASFLGKDDDGERVKQFLRRNDINFDYVDEKLKETPTSVILYDKSGKRNIQCDLKDIQDKMIDEDTCRKITEKNYDAAVICNINFNRNLLKECSKNDMLIATDVQVLADIDDEYNKDFMEYADILFFSDENVKGDLREFILKVAERYNNKIIVVGRGKKGAALYSRDEDMVYMVDAVDVRPVVNTVGAGDALFTSFIHYYLNGDKPIDCLKKAQIFASYKIGESGASIGFPTEDIVEKYYREIYSNN